MAIQALAAVRPKALRPIGHTAVRPIGAPVVIVTFLMKAAKQPSFQKCGDNDWSAQLIDRQIADRPAKHFTGGRKAGEARPKANYTPPTDFYSCRSAQLTGRFRLQKRTRQSLGPAGPQRGPAVRPVGWLRQPTGLLGPGVGRSSSRRVRFAEKTYAALMIWGAGLSPFRGSAPLHCEAVLTTGSGALAPQTTSLGGRRGLRRLNEDCCCCCLALRSKAKQQQQLNGIAATGPFCSFFQKE